MARATLRRLFLATLALLPLAAGPALAQQPGGADLNISPKRLVLGGTNRSGVVYVFNRGTTGASYAIDLVDRVMLADGQILPLAEITQDADAAAVASRLKSARAMISFSPRRVTLGPGESQTVRVRALTPAGLASGEYRTHLTVATLPPEDAGLTAEQAASVDESQLGARVIALLALSIPVIVRQEVAPGSATIEHATYELSTSGDADSPPATVDIALARSGEASVYGNLEVVAESASGKPETLGAIKGLAVYPEISSRSASIPLSRAPLAGERLSVRFTDDDVTPGKVLATANVDAR